MPIINTKFEDTKHVGAVLDIIRNMLNFAKSGDFTAKQKINNVTVMVRGDSSINLIFLDYRQAISDDTAKDVVIGPYSKDPLKKENDKRIEEENERRRQEVEITCIETNICGEKILSIIQEMINFAKNGDFTAKQTMNGIEVEVKGDSNPYLIFRDEQRAQSGYIEGKVGPYPKDQLTAEEVENDARVEAEKEQRSQKLSSQI